ncbi:MAG: alpha/beta fold hydrolase [Fibrobacteria bacterium]|nr:alpha/beta fold hydrolase [Fibrobacteria bacterium]
MILFEDHKRRKYERRADGLIKGAEPFEMGKGDTALLFIHGWTSSPRELRFLAEKLSGKHFCKGILLQGHGLTPEVLEQYHWKTHLSQLTEEIRALKQTYQKVFLIGLSYGSTLSLHAASKESIDGAILMCPFVYSAKKVFLGIPDTFFVPYLPKKITAICKQSQSPILKKGEFEQHITYDIMPMASLKSLIQSGKSLRPLLSDISCPILLMHSLHDTSAAFKSSVVILKKLGSTDKRLIALEKSNHILTLDNDRDFIEKETADWLMQHT